VEHFRGTMKINDVYAFFFSLWWYNTTMQERNTTSLLPSVPSDVHAMLNDMLAKATRNAEAQAERTRQFEIKREREMVMKAKRDAENKCRNILQGH
jgi:hypothetical protein